MSKIASSFLLKPLIIISILCSFLDPVLAKLKEGQRFGDWEVIYLEHKEMGKLCTLTQRVTMENKVMKISGREFFDFTSSMGEILDNGFKLLATYQITYFENSLIMLQIVPSQVNTKIATSIIHNHQNIAEGKFYACNENICTAIAEISDSSLKSLLSVPDKINLLSVVTKEGAEVAFPLSAKGLKDGLKELQNQ